MPLKDRESELKVESGICNETRLFLITRSPPTT